MGAASEPVPFEVYEAGVYLHGTKADLAGGEMLVPGRVSNSEKGRVMNYVYFTATHAAVFGRGAWAGLHGRADGRIRGRPQCHRQEVPWEPTQSFRSREPLRVVSELVDWVGHSEEKLQAMRHGLDALKRQGAGQIED